MKFLPTDQLERQRKGHYDETMVIEVEESLRNIADGGEFIDDAIRMYDQPFMDTHTEESVAPGNAKDLW